MKETPRRHKLARLVLVAVFITAAQGEAVGLRHCSLHDALPGLVEAGSQLQHQALGPGPAGDLHEDPHDDGYHVAGGSHEHGDTPAGCLDECHAPGSARAAPGGAMIVLSGDMAAAPSTISGGGVFIGARHLPYELHLPNAPPRRG